jgi:hypothetical protein
VSSENQPLVATLRTYSLPFRVALGRKDLKYEVVVKTLCRSAGGPISGRTRKCPSRLTRTRSILATNGGDVRRLRRFMVEVDSVSSLQVRLRRPPQ